MAVIFRAVVRSRLEELPAAMLRRAEHAAVDHRRLRLTFGVGVGAARSGYAAWKVRSALAAAHARLRAPTIGSVG